MGIDAGKQRPQANHGSGRSRLRERAGAVERSRPDGLADASRTASAADTLALQRLAGNAVTGRALALQRARLVQRTIDQDARTAAMDWVATRNRPFGVAVDRLRLPKLMGILDGAAGQADRTLRSTNTTALATALVRLGERDLGKLAASLRPGRQADAEILRALEGHVPEQLRPLEPATPATQAAFDAIATKIKDPYLTLKLGGATFTFSRDMALHMLRRHHPDYLVGDPMQVQSYFPRGTRLAQIEALVVGAINTQAGEVKRWRARRAKLKDAELASPAGTTLNLRPFFDGMYWELTLTLPDTNPMAAAGRVAHFTPTL